MARTGRRTVLLAAGTIVACVAIGAGLFSVVRGGSGTAASCDPDSGGWNGAGGGPQHTGMASGAIRDPGAGWAPSWSSTASAPPSVANGTVYTATATGALVALDAAHGTVQWTAVAPQGEQGTVGVPIAIDGCAAVLGVSFRSGAGVLRAVDLRSHQQRWSVQVAGQVFSAPEIVDGVAYAGLSFAAAPGSPVHVLDGYDVPDGTRSYRKTFSAAVLASPTSDHQRIWIGDLDQNLYALGPVGRQLWTYSTGGIITTPAMYDGRSVVVASADHTVASLDPGSGQVHWSATVGEVQASMAVTGDAVVVADTGGTVHALRTSDGTERWHVNVGAKVTRGVAAAGDRIFVAADDGVLHVLDRASGAPTAAWTAPAPPAGPPAIAAGHLYLTCQDGRLYALPL
jgi:outer membrane protein assembly factor BamB